MCFYVPTPAWSHHTHYNVISATGGNIIEACSRLERKHCNERIDARPSSTVPACSLISSSYIKALVSSSALLPLDSRIAVIIIVCFTHCAIKCIISNLKRAWVLSALKCLDFFLSFQGLKTAAISRRWYGKTVGKSVSDALSLITVKQSTSSAITIQQATSLVASERTCCQSQNRPKSLLDSSPTWTVACRLDRQPAWIFPRWRDGQPRHIFCVNCCACTVTPVHRRR